MGLGFLKFIGIILNKLSQRWLFIFFIKNCWAGEKDLIFFLIFNFDGNYKIES